MQKIAIYMAGLCLALLATPGLAGQWHVAETDHFRVYSKGSTADLERQTAVLEDYRALLDALTTRPANPSEPKLDIFLLDGIGQARPFGSMSRGIAGFYSPTSGRIAAYAITDDDASEQYLLHEYAHHYMLATPGNIAYPGWYVEGFAEYFMTAQFTPGQIQVGKANVGRGEWLAYSEWMPIDRVITGKFTRGLDVPRFYAQSWLMTHYLLRTPGMAPKLAAYLQALTAGQDNIVAFRENIMPPTKLQEELLNYMTVRKMTMTSYTRSSRTAAEVKVTALPESADPLLLLLTNLEYGLPKDQRDRAVKRVREVAARLPGDPLAERTLAYAEMRYGDQAQGIQLLDKLLAAHPDDATLLRWRGEAEWPRQGTLDAVQAKAARKFLARAYKLDPGDWRTLYRYAMVEDPFVRKLDDGTLNVLLQAHQLAPQVDEIGVAAAAALVRADRLPDAMRMIEPIANASHFGKIAEASEALLTQLKAGDTAGFLAAAGPAAKMIREAGEE